MIRKTYILPLMLLIGFSLCLINSFADEVDEKGEFGEDDFILKADFEFPTAEGPAYIQGTPEFQKVPEQIIGTADFEKMRNLPQQSQDYQLGTKVGWFLVPQRNSRRFWICTGFLVGPDLFMTNHHCIHDDFGPLPLSDARIYMDYYQDEDVDPTYGGITAGVSAVIREDALKDYALLRLDTAIGNTYGWLELDATTRVNSSQSVKLISHNRGRSKEIVRRNSQIVNIPAGHPLLEEPFALVYLADSEPGSSGSPVFLRDGTGVIAIHHSAWTRGGVPQFNAGSLMSYIVPEIRQWLPGASPTPPPPTPPSAGKLMYWVDYGTNKIQRANLNGTNVQDLVTGLRTPEGIALDMAGGKMYWSDTDTDKIQRSNLDGSHIEDLVTRGLSAPESIALDVAGGKIYWTDTGTDKIQRANLNGTNVQDIIARGLSNPEGIALDVKGGKMYWAEYSSNKIRRANLDGSNIENLITTGLRDPDGIALGIPQAPGPDPPNPGPTPGSLDVNGDGRVDVLDLVLVAVFYGTRGSGIPADVNADGIVNVQDFAAVAAGVDAANALPLKEIEAALLAAAAAAGEAAPGAPVGVGAPTRAVLFANTAYGNVAAALTDARTLVTGDVQLGKWLPLLEELLQVLAEMRTIPETTALLPNYPNPFNPETWIPYHLSKETEVTVTIHDVRGVLVRELTLGHQSAGVYESRGRAAYWDGKNQIGEPVASGVYFYTLTAGEFNATRKLLIAK